MLASAILKVVYQKISSAIQDKMKVQEDFVDHLERMKMTLESVAALLNDAERRSVEEDAVRLWLKRLKDAMYGIHDMIDECEAGTKPAASTGFGGIGKTTLAKLVFNDTYFKDHSQVWIYVSQILNVNKIGNSIISQLSKEESKLNPNNNKKVMIVLDDVWEENDSQLNELKAMLPVIKGGKVVVIVTTRDEHIARKICTVQPYKLLPLSDETCWAIIKQKSDFEARDDKEYLCGGVALAAQALGYMLKPLTFGEWESVRNSDIWNASTSEQESLAHHNVLACLLKLCFAYCAFFPKGYKLEKNDLIYQWIAHGFIAASSIFSTRQYGENYAKHLLGMSFLQHSKDSSSPLKLYVASPAKIRALRFLGYGRTGIHGAAFSSAKYLRVLDLSECYIAKLPNSIGELKQLRYLNAQGVQDKVIPRSITQLFKLNYLNLGGSLITELPESFGKMKSLMHLNLSSCLKLVKLPKSFVDLKELVHLDLHNCRNVDIIPGLLVELKELAYLDLSKCIRVKATAEDLGGLAKLQYLDLSGTFMGKKIMFGLKKAMSNLTDLRYLGISAIRGLSAVEMDSFIDCVSLLSNLEHLKLSHNREMVSLPESISSLRKLRILDLSACNSIERLPEGMLKMHCLRILKVDNCYNLDMPTLSNIEVQSGGDSRSHHMLGHGNPDKSLKISGLECMRFPELSHSIERMRKQRTEKLELEWNRNDKTSLQEDIIILGELLPPMTLRYLKLHGYYNSVSFPAWLMSISQYLPNLVEIRMWGLPKCNSLPPFGQLPNLRELFIGGMDSVTKIGEGFYGGRGAFPKLWEFELRCMENLEEWKTVYSDLEHDVHAVMSVNLDRLTLQDCPKLRLKPCPPSAKHWEIENCDNVLTLWDEGTQTCASSTTLREVTVKYSNVPLHQWRLLHHLPALTSLRIEGCSNLKCSSQKIMQGFSALQSLHLEANEQPELPHWLGEVTTLRELDIRGYPDLQAPLEIMSKLTSLHSLCLFRCEAMTSTPQWLGELISLEELLISDCPKLKILHGSMQHLSSLQSLSVHGCDSIQSLPEYLGNLLSLRRIEITCCRGITSLPESIKKLTKLQDLHILECPELRRWCQLKENKKKLAHIERKL
ncbi:hypothetical protein HU200_033462 [Digitaria exilis]|uniref:Uncharacterized protein n=1 Tax=Digitaria exilis TaxID=1010633 RepID=A0A835BRQ5_9POAL|nr:hypothetical protein HU200_033462 [Digitaria exilis]